MNKPVCYDVTHLVSRLGIASPSGIDNVDLAYGKHFAARDLGPFVHYGWSAPHVLARERVRGIVAEAQGSHWHSSSEQGPEYLAIHAALTGKSGDPHTRSASKRHRKARWPDVGRWVHQTKLRLARDAPSVPKGAVYLNVAQHVFEEHRFFNWLHKRPDVRSVFFIHDLLPLDLPEFFRPGYRERFALRVDTAVTHGRAFIVSSAAVRRRLEEELAARGAPQRPILVAPLPSNLPALDPASLIDPALAAVPYFITVGTIEPRKNQLLLLNIWRQLAETAATAQPIPKLVLIGGRGWENEQILDVLDRSLLVRPHILEAKGLNPFDLARLMTNARALLMPSFAEGYGLPIVEALSLRTPVVATDAPVFREVSQGQAKFLGPLDGQHWKQAVTDLVGHESQLSKDLREAANRFVPPDWTTYFSRIEDMLTVI